MILAKWAQALRQKWRELRSPGRFGEWPTQGEEAADLFASLADDPGGTSPAERLTETIVPRKRWERLGPDAGLAIIIVGVSLYALLLFFQHVKHAPRENPPPPGPTQGEAGGR